MSITKIPFIFGVTTGILIALAEPAPPLQDGERMSAEKKGVLKPAIFLPLIKAIFWALAIVEVAAIVANNAMPPSISSASLSVLMLEGNAEGVRMAPLSAFGTILTVLGGLIRLYTYRWMGRHFTFELSIRKDHKLITGGPYGVVRHPGYTGGILVQFGTIFFFVSRGSWLRESAVLDTLWGRMLIGVVTIIWLLPLVVIKRRIRIEDTELRKTFGNAWDKWAGQVPNVLIPGIY